MTMTTWQVDSATQPGVKHTVRKVGSRLVCSCTGFKYRNDCWHITMIAQGLPGGHVEGFLLAALRYRDLGYHVIPCEPGGKRPLVHWLDVQETMPSVDQICTWWAKWPEANVALVLGRGIFAIDLDGGSQALELLARAGYVVPAGAPVSRTHSGFHVLMSADGPVPDRVGLLRSTTPLEGAEPTPTGKPRFAQVDVRGQGIIVVEPSVHPSGSTYEWVIPLVSRPPAAQNALLTFIRTNPKKDPMPTCRWVNHSDFSKPETMYCGAKVGWTMVTDDDGNKVRKYDNLCATHEAEAALVGDADENDEN